MPGRPDLRTSRARPPYRSTMPDPSGRLMVPRVHKEPLSTHNCGEPRPRNRQYRMRIGYPALPV